MEYIQLDKDDTLKLRRNLRKSDKERLHEIGVKCTGPRSSLVKGGQSQKASCTYQKSHAITSQVKLASFCK